MLDTDTKRRIDTARDILVGKVPDDPQRGSVRDGSTVDLPRRTESVPGSATPRTLPQGSANPGLNDASPLGLVKSASNGGTLPGFEIPEPRAKAKAQPDDSDDEPERPTHPRDLEKSDLMYRLRQVQTEHGPYRGLLPPFTFTDVEMGMGPVPAIGQHTDAILAELGYDAADIAAMHALGAV